MEEWVSGTEFIGQEHALGLWLAQLCGAYLHLDRARGSVPGLVENWRGDLPVPEHGRYSMISSARASTDGGIVRPRVLAVLRLMTNSNFVGCKTGRSAGLSPLRMRPA